MPNDFIPKPEELTPTANRLFGMRQLTDDAGNGSKISLGSGSKPGLEIGLRLGLGIGLGTLTLAGLYYASQIESKAFKLEHFTLYLDDTTSGGIVKQLPLGQKSSSLAEAGKKTLRVLHLSDLHLIEPEREKLDFLRKITAENDLDLVVLTGDVFQNETGLKYAKNILARSPRLGAYAILGNHDYYSYNMVNKTIGRLYKKLRNPKKPRDVKYHLAALEDAGFHVLHNDIARFKEDRLAIIGIDYFGIKEESLKQMAASVEEHDLLLALFHVPKKLNDMAAAGIHLAFGGHTHGGQIRIPGIGALITDSELKRNEASGLIRRGRTLFHVSRGLGADPRSNFRLFCPPAATILEVIY